MRELLPGWRSKHAAQDAAAAARRHAAASLLQATWRGLSLRRSSARVALRLHGKRARARAADSIKRSWRARVLREAVKVHGLRNAIGATEKFMIKWRKQVGWPAASPPARPSMCLSTRQPPFAPTTATPTHA